MGLDVYAYIVIGVQADKYIKEETRIITYNITYHDGTIIYDKDGKPRTANRGQEFFTFQGKEYGHVYDIEMVKKTTHKTRYSELDIYSFGYNELLEQDTIGLLVCDTSQEGGGVESTTLENLNEKFELAKKLLLELGITEEPTIRLVMRWSD